MKPEDFTALNANKITCVDTEKGYMQLLEYTLQDLSSLHVLQWSTIYEYETILDTLLPKRHTETFYNDKNTAMKKAYEIGKILLEYENTP